MEILEFILQATDNLAVIVLVAWVMAERKDSKALFQIIQSLSKLRLKHIEDNAESAFIELE